MTRENACSAATQSTPGAGRRIMRCRTALVRMAQAACASGMFVPLSAVADVVFANPLSTMVFLEAYAAPVYVQPGVVRTTFGSGPLADQVVESYGANTAAASATVDAQGLHATASVGNALTDLGPYAAFAQAVVSLDNPFILVPQAGFAGSQAWIRIHYEFSGGLSDPITDCANCFAAVQANLWMAGQSGVLGNQFSFFGHTRGPVGDAVDLDGDVARDGWLSALVPVNTELRLRGGLSVRAGCETSVNRPAVSTCLTSAFFGDTLGYVGSSPDAVDIVWGLAPVSALPVPEPATALLCLAGLAVLGWQCRGRRDAAVQPSPLQAA